MDNLFGEKVMLLDRLFDHTYLNVRVLYLYLYNRIPDEFFVSRLEGEKAFNAFRSDFKAEIVGIHQLRVVNGKTNKADFDKTVVRLRNHYIMEFDDGCCRILHEGGRDPFLIRVTEFLTGFRERERRKPLEINLIVQTSEGLELRPLEINRTNLDIDLFYEQDFGAVDNLIRKRLNRKNDRGIVLLHGLPGTGKTTYLRYLVGKIKKKVLFLSPSVAGNLMNPEFIELLIDNPNSVLIIEDAENIIMDRRFNGSSSVSNLLNISDGMLSDFLNVQLICTFNNSLTLVDNALLRKGRIIVKYEFGRLGVDKARRLAAHVGVERPINQPMTIAEIVHPDGVVYDTGRVEVTGFRRNENLVGTV